MDSLLPEPGKPSPPELELESEGLSSESSGGGEVMNLDDPNGESKA
jgi:hypothetical protein